MNARTDCRVVALLLPALLGLATASWGAEPAGTAVPKAGGTSASLFAYDPPGPGLHANLDAGVGWQSGGNAGFTIEEFFGVLSRLTYPLDGSVGEVSGEVSYQAKWWEGGIRARYVTDISVEGRSLDEDFMDAPGLRSDFSHSDCTVEQEVWDLDVVARALPFAGMGDRVPPALKTLKAGLSAGYGVQSFDFHDQNLEANYNYGTDVYYLPGPLGDYAVDFSGVRLGASLSSQPFDRLTVFGEFILIPGLQAESDAYWNLRNYPFQQEAEGSGSILSVGARVAITQRLSAFTSAQWVSLIADQNGTESGVADGVLPYNDLPLVGEITAEYVRVDLGLSVSL